MTRRCPIPASFRACRVPPPHCACRYTEGGFTVLEMAVALAVLMTVLGALLAAVRETGAAVAAQVSSVDLDLTMQRALDRVVRELADSGGDESGDYVLSHPADASTVESFVTFQRREGLAGTAADWSTSITFDLRPSAGEDPTNSADDDGDGLVDERLLVRTQDGESRPVADGVSDFVVSRAAGARMLEVVVTVSRPDPQAGVPLSRSLAARVALRNQP